MNQLTLVAWRFKLSEESDTHERRVRLLAVAGFAIFALFAAIYSSRVIFHNARSWSLVCDEVSPNLEPICKFEVSLLGKIIIAKDRARLLAWKTSRGSLHLQFEDGLQKISAAADFDRRMSQAGMIHIQHDPKTELSFWLLTVAPLLNLMASILFWLTRLVRIL